MKIQNNFHRFLAASAAGLWLAGQSAFAQIYTWTTVAGLGLNPGLVDGTNNAARFNAPFGIAEDGAGNLLVTDSGNTVIRKITANGTNWAVTTIVGGNPKYSAATGNNQEHDGSGTNAAFSNPLGLATSSPGQFFEVENDYSGAAFLRELTVASGIWSVTTMSDGGYLNRFNTDAGTGVAVDGAGDVFMTISGNHQILLAVSQGAIWKATVIAGSSSGLPGTVDGTNTAALFNAPQGICVDMSGNVYIADTGNNTIRKLARDPITPDWITTTIAGQAGVAGFLDGTNGATLFNTPDGIAVDSGGNLIVSDAANNVIRKLTPQGTNWVVSTIGGQLNRFHGTTDGVGTAASFYHPAMPMVDSLGRIFVADNQNNTIRMGVPSVATNQPPVVQMASAGNTAYVIWPSSATGMVLQTTTNIALGNWQTVTAGITTNLIFSGPMTNAQTFYRLQQQ